MKSFSIIIILTSFQLTIARISSIECKLPDREKELINAFNLLLQYPDSNSIANKFINLFPNSFNEVNRLFGYPDSSILYNDNYKYNNMLSQIDNQVDSVYYLSKLINIGIDGVYGSSEMSLYIQNTIQYEVLKRPLLAADILSNFSDDEIINFFYFFFIGIHPRWEKIPDELLVIRNYFPKVNSLMNIGFKKAIKDCGHHLINDHQQ